LLDLAILLAKFYFNIVFKQSKVMKRILLLSLISILTLSLSAQSRNILLEEFSTAPCGFCPDGDLVAEQLIKDHPNVIWVTHHAGFGTDSMTVPESVTMANAFTTFAPGAAIDRGDYQIPVYTIAPYIAVSRQKWDSICTVHLGDNPVVKIGIQNTFNPATRMYDCLIEATFVSAPASGDIRINVYLVEDSVVGNGHGYDQKSYFNTTPGHPYYQKGDTIIGYVHHHIVRKFLGGAWGSTGVIPNTPVVGTKYSKLYSGISIPSKWREKKMDVVAFVSYYNTSASMRPVINSNHKSLLDASGTGISEPGAAQVNQLYPNPAHGNIRIENAGSGTLTLTDLTGKQIASYPVNGPATISLMGIAPGIYFYTLTSDGEAQNGKLVVN
jgi:hypothetical protein